MEALPSDSIVQNDKPRFNDKGQIEWMGRSLRVINETSISDREMILEHLSRYKLTIQSKAFEGSLAKLHPEESCGPEFSLHFDREGIPTIRISEESAPPAGETLSTTSPETRFHSPVRTPTTPSQPTDSQKRLDDLQHAPDLQSAPKAERDRIISQAKRALAAHFAPVEAIEQQARSAIEALIQTSRIADSVGNKAANLGRLRTILHEERGVEVPAFVGVPHEEVFRWIQSHFPAINTLWGRFQEAIRSGTAITDEPCKQILIDIQEGIQRAFTEAEDFPCFEDLQDILQQSRPLMVRSTGKEDSLQLANPGGNESVANVPPRKDSVAAAMSTVVASYFSPKSLGQRQASGDDITETPFMPILVQVMAKVPVAGVMYTTEGELNTPGVTQISSAFGHGEDVVTGSAPSDTYYVQGDMVHAIIRDKPTKKVPSARGNLETKRNPPGLQRSSSLPPRALVRLAEIGRRIEEAYGYPMDVEWSYDPVKDSFAIFQARPIPQQATVQPTHIDPEKIQRLQQVRQVTVIGAAGGRVRELRKDNTITAESAPEALEQFLKDPSHPPQAILLHQTTATNSHEAGFFRERGIPIIHVGSHFDEIKETLRGHTVLADVQEGLLGTLPPRSSSSDFIVEGLRRHLAPKMESTISEEIIDLSEFRTTLGEEAKKAHFAEAEALVESTFGRNILDKLMNAYERASSAQDKAYILKRLLVLVGKVHLSKIPQEQRGPLFAKIERNAAELWRISTSPNTTPLEVSFAMNWLRAALLQRPAAGVVNADTLYVALGEAQERSLIEEKPESELHDIFLRSSKFILHPESKRAWNEFIQNLSPQEHETLGRLFTLFGPSVVETWINAVFPTVWKASEGSGKEKASTCLKALVQQTQTPGFSRIFEVMKKAQEAIQRLQTYSATFADPNKFEETLQKLESEFLPVAQQCTEAMERATGFDRTLLAHSFRPMLEAYDLSIKALTSSPNYQGNLQLKAERFARLLAGYHDLAQRMMSQSMLKDDPQLQLQALKLAPFLDRMFSTLSELPHGPEKALAPTPAFSVSMLALGSNYGVPDRVMSSSNSLEDFFTTLHQSMITATASVEQKSGISIDDLPPELKTYCDTILHQLNLTASFPSELPSPPKVSIQSIEYRHPKVLIAFNCPLNFHSAQFILEASIGDNGHISSMNFEGRFFTADQREADLRSYALSTYYGDEAMRAPDGGTLKPTTQSGVSFHWELLPVKTRSTPNTSFQRAMVHIQNMINFLQETNTDPVNECLTAQIIRENPWAFTRLMQQPEKKERQQALAGAYIAGILKEEWDESNIPEILSNLRAIQANFPSLILEWDGILDKLSKNKVLWSNAALFKESLNFFMFINKRYHELQESDSSIIEHLPTIPNELITKIRSTVEKFQEGLNMGDTFPEFPIVYGA